MAASNPSFLKACRGERPDRSPIWLMRQAGRYMPEYRAIRSKVDFETLCRTPELCAEVTLQPIDRFDLDAAILFSDILVVLDALGMRVKFDPAPVIESPLRSRADLDKLRFGSVQEHLAYVFAAVRACKAALADRVPLIGFCGAPWTIASYLVEGGTSKDFLQIKRFMWQEPAAFDQLMQGLTTLSIEYLREQVAAGVDALQVFDSWAGALSPRDYRERVLPHMRRLFDEIATLGVPVIAFVRGSSSHLAALPELKADVFGLDWSLELEQAIARLGPERVLQGNLDPAVLLGPVATMEQRAKSIVEMGRACRGFVFNLGHGILPQTDPAMVQRLVELVHAS